MSDLANALRFLSVDAIEQAQSGHPGMPLGMADVAAVLWREVLSHSPQHPAWANRDRFVLSNGHGSALLYSLLYLSGYPLKVEELVQFRQLHSLTPGHPEVGLTPGVEATTGPLGQGLAMAVGMALAESQLAATYNRPKFPIIDHRTFCFVGDGCLMEGISHEVASFAGAQQLGKLVVLWDDNGISIDGPVAGVLGESVPARFSAYGWHVLAQVDGHDPAAVRVAIQAALAQTDKPSLICCQTQIGFGSLVQGTAKAHGAPLGAEGIEALRRTLNWPHAPFEIPDTLLQQWDATQAGHAAVAAWQALWQDYQIHHPELATTLQRRLDGRLPANLDQQFNTWWQLAQTQLQPMATRQASHWMIEKLTPLLPELLGGAADLASSTLTTAKQAVACSAAQPHGNVIAYGVREFGMAAIMNGLALHGGVIPFGGTFLVFLDYARSAVRMSALMQQRVIFIATHDSIALGEDGPTHQPVEQLSMWRLTPEVTVWRPANLLETVVAWEMALQHKRGPSLLCLSRQKLPTLAGLPITADQVRKGGYVLRSETGSLQLALLATGSEVSLACEAAARLQEEGVGVRVVSLPCLEIWETQSKAYQAQVLPPDCLKIAIEAGAKDCWYRWVGPRGRVIGLHSFGLSAPGRAVMQAAGITVESVMQAAMELLRSASHSVS